MLRIKILGTVLVATMLALTIACSKDPEVAKRKYMQSGDDYVARGKYPEAIIQYRNAIAADPKFGEARLKLGDAYMHTADARNAYAEYVRAADLMPTNIDAQLNGRGFFLAAHGFPLLLSVSCDCSEFPETVNTGTEVTNWDDFERCVNG